MTTRKEPTPLRQQIDQYRKQRGMTTKQLYTEAGLSRASYYRKITENKSSHSRNCAASPEPSTAKWKYF